MSAVYDSMMLLDAIKQVVGHRTPTLPVPLHEPHFHGTAAWDYVKDCLDSGWVSTGGHWVSRFEQELRSVTNASYAVAVSNGTVALRLALYLVGVRPGDEVLLPPLSFVATANAVSHLGAVPHFVDVEATGLGLCPAALARRLEDVAERHDEGLVNRDTGRRISAVLPVHVFGHPAEISQLRSVSEAWGLPLVEDAAEALGSWREETHCGLFGNVGILSFNGNKLITTGGGGALITNDPQIAHRARHLSTTAKLPHQWDFEHDSIGWNDRLPNLNAALGVAQLEDLERRLEAKQRLAADYAKAISEFDNVAIVPEPVGCRSNNWLVSIRFTTEDPAQAHSQRLELLEVSHSSGLLLRPIWTPLHHLQMYHNCPSGALNVAEDQAPRLLNLPSSPQLSKSWQ